MTRYLHYPALVLFYIAFTLSFPLILMMLALGFAFGMIDLKRGRIYP